MIKKLDISYENNIAYRLKGKINIEEENKWLLEIEDVLTNHSQFKLMVVLDPGAHWDLKSGLEEIKWLSKHMDNFSKIAIVSNSTVWEYLVKIDSLFAKLVNIDEKFFKDEDEAWNWITE